MSIEFIKPIDTALSELETLLTGIDCKITRTADINKGSGTKLHGIIGTQSFSLILYYNRSKGLSSKIVFEKIPDTQKEVFQKCLSNSVNEIQKIKAIPIHATITVADKTLRQNIQGTLRNQNFEIINSGKLLSHLDYSFKIRMNNDELTITQYSSGALVIQGAYSNLVDAVVDIIDSIKSLSIEERALLYASEATREILSNQISEQHALFEKAFEVAETTSSDYFDFLFENDQKSHTTGDALLEILEKETKTLPEYNFLIAIYAKVFEGFIIKLLITKEFFTLEEFKDNPDKADIGNALRKRKFEKYIQNIRRDGYIIEKLISVWEGCRCKEMHSDPVAIQGIISIPTLEKAKYKIGEIKSCLDEAYNILVMHGLTDKDIKKDVLVGNSISSPLLCYKPTKGYIGTDESGKGDYFGPLVIAGVFLDSTLEDKLAKAGIRDSKTISDKNIYEFAKIIRSNINKSYYQIIVINPEKYNDLYAKMNNLNRLLAWGHARAIENILEAGVECHDAIADQFGDESLIQNALLKKGKNINLKQQPKAEEHIAVAAASILAREAFLSNLKSLHSQYNYIEFHKGASPLVIEQAKKFVNTHGEESLKKVAKLHFKTTKDVLGQ